MSAGLTDSDLPGFWRSANAASLRGQAWVLRYQRGRLGGALLAALSGALTWKAGAVDLAAALIAAGFFIAFVCEIASWVHRPENDWYLGRALAESVKTLAWRYAVAADPFGPHLNENQAHDVMRERLSEILDETKERIVVETPAPEFTPKMEELRVKSFAERRDAYIQGRTEDQRKWYAEKAAHNRQRALLWRIALITAETIALVLATLRITTGWSINFAGLLGAFIGAGAAWMALKQYTTLASAYSTASNELAIQTGKLRERSESEWPLVAADAEEAISREHTLWMASRLGKILPRRPSQSATPRDIQAAPAGGVAEGDSGP
jgi:hypothetical protein